MSKEFISDLYTMVSDSASSSNMEVKLKSTTLVTSYVLIPWNNHRCSCIYYVLLNLLGFIAFIVRVFITAWHTLLYLSDISMICDLLGRFRYSLLYHPLWWQHVRIIRILSLSELTYGVTFQSWFKSHLLYSLSLRI